MNFAAATLLISTRFPGLSRYPEERPNYLTLLEPVSPETWLCTLVAILSVCLVLVMVGRVRLNKNDIRDPFQVATIDICAILAKICCKEAKLHW